MELIKVIVFDLLASAPILVGVIALTGLILQKQPTDKIISGTLKTIVGFLVFGIGSGAAVVALDSFQVLFSAGFGLKGVLPLAEAVTALAQDKFGTTVSLVMLLGFLCNLIVAKFTPLKYIFLTGQHNLYLAALLTIMFKALGLGNTTTILFGGIMLGICAALFPAIAQPYMRKVTGDDEIAMGHYVTVGYAIAGWIGSKIGDPEKSTEDLKLPGWLTMFKDYVVGVSITMIIFFYIAAIAAGKATVEELSGGVNWLVYPLFQGLTFSAALYVIITGVRLFLGEIVGAFVGISERLIPNAKPALDCPVVFPFAPTATVLGFLAAYAGGLLSMVVMGVLGTIVIIPVAVPYFFIGATAGVFGNATGGWKGCIAGAFVVGILIAVGPALIYPIMENIGLVGTSFPETDFNIVGLLIYYIGRFLQSIF
ncbi:PTS transporter subunit IIC (plasmid) [Vagococcus lutrae]|uniref:PTS ascorbate transporter subunit IIC n=1 Tax=Vagococcus lutrae TaxID=81947 RepID=UPI00232E7AF2|nr:PTS ascorbate transporter subunit IIC [Vagococcus lutrae]WCG06104.1 PTS transporter subunit IIC [Vagococcus lutrae]